MGAYHHRPATVSQALDMLTPEDVGPAAFAVGRGTA